MKVIVCADDYGLTPGVGLGIRELIQANRITATSCMTVSPHWPKEAEALLPFASQCDIGLHLCLTDYLPLGPVHGLTIDGRFPSFGELARRAYKHNLPYNAIHSECIRQFDAFEEAFGRFPDFIDGHHHVQQLPGIRTILLEIFSERLSADSAYIRCAAESISTILRRGVAISRTIAIGLPGRALRRVAKKRGIPFNPGFAGIYDYTDSANYSERFERFLVGVRERTIIMCHPGRVDAELRHCDILTDQRETELTYLLSQDYIDALQKANLSVGRFFDTN